MTGETKKSGKGGFYCFERNCDRNWPLRFIISGLDGYFKQEERKGIETGEKAAKFRR